MAIYSKLKKLWVKSFPAMTPTYTLLIELTHASSSLLKLFTKLIINNSLSCKAPGAALSSLADAKPNKTVGC